MIDDNVAPSIICQPHESSARRGRLGFLRKPSDLHGDGLFTNREITVADWMKSPPHFYGTLVTEERHHQLAAMIEKKDQTPSDIQSPAEQVYVKLAQEGIFTCLDISDAATEWRFMLVDRDCPLSYLNSTNGVVDADDRGKYVKVKLGPMHAEAGSSPLLFHCPLIFDGDDAVVQRGVELLLDYALHDDASSGDVAASSHRRVSRRVDRTVPTVDHASRGPASSSSSSHKRKSSADAILPRNIDRLDNEDQEFMSTFQCAEHARQSNMIEDRFRQCLTLEQTAESSPPQFDTAPSYRCRHQLASPLIDLARHPVMMFALYGYALIPPDDESEQLAAELCAAIKGPTFVKTARNTTNIAGGVVQLLMTDDESYVAKLKGRWEALIRQRVGVVNAAAAHWNIHSQKGLHGKKDANGDMQRERNGLQPPHWDSVNIDTEVERITMLMSCSEISRCTSMPRFTKGELITKMTEPIVCSLPSSSSSDSPSSSASSSSSASPSSSSASSVQSPSAGTIRDHHYRMQMSTRLLDPINFHSMMVKRGTIMIIDQSIVHHGVNIDGQDDRVQMYSMMSLPKAKEHDKEQYYAWQLVMDAYGVDSDEFRDAVWKYRYHSPQTRHNADLNRIIASIISSRENSYPYLQSTKRSKSS